ncbi:DUF6090 family protein [Flavobacteriaceae bacterium LMO-SS05]
MIKLFRNIRKNLITQGKTTNYLKYAIGEIVLVVIGILIALSINNWNEQRKERQELLNIYEIVVEDLKNDINEVKVVLNYKKERLPYFDKILDGKMTLKDYYNCSFCISLINGYPDWAVDERGVGLLKNRSFDVSKTKDSLQIQITQFYTKYNVEFVGDDILRSNNLQKDILDWEKNYPWYANFITGRNNEEFIQYALTDQDYKNRVATYYLLHYSIYIPLLKSFINDAQKLIKEIDKRLEP